MEASSAGPMGTTGGRYNEPRRSEVKPVECDEVDEAWGGDDEV